MRTAALFALVIALGAAIGIGLKQASSPGGTASAYPEALKPSVREVERKLGGAPPALAALHAQSNELLGGGRDALRERLAQVKGHAAVVNVWASWCGPCRAEMPVLQRVALDRGREVAFIGVNLKDERAAAQRFLRRAPVSFPSYEDPDGEIYDWYRLAGAPATVFYDARGRRAFVHQGPYESAEDLEEDIDRYALGTAS
jgi:thiol-disulfide isomerase/thioredoxin